MKRPRIADLAREAGVSVATVDRLLNGREGVRGETALRVQAAAERLGFHASRLIAQRMGPDLPELRFGVVLHKQGQDFYRAFAEELARAVAAAQGVRGRLVLEFSASQSPADMAGLLRAMAGRCDVLAATAVNHPEVTAAVEAVTAQGLAVFSLLSDFAQGVRTGYLGLNNLKVGRTAGWMMGLAAREPGKMAVFVGGHRWHGHELRETGFRSHLRECAPHLAVLDTVVNLETRQLTYEAVLALLARHPDLRGIYVAGGGMEGAIAALREVGAGEVGAGGAGAGGVALVVSALTPDSRAGLAEGVVTLVIDTPLEKLCRDLVALMASAVRDGAWPGGVQHFLAPDLHVAESL
ncbi:LacI family DNA-binding transcriptional regulator [Fertoebacter nigrum]|uniref:LacI family DNA-binding transcriptional regulator n=1 Tax=Fertoeibacter niger TaxID=2656921 RepID=A0A8X8H9R2_9RHOB|nr:LacI family DNA-binding transcriptional regulator [Fertoeibacter niger]NUB46276.1 LacI family DNA-binding transcriptional regulator [Fertoeibacter niger]